MISYDSRPTASGIYIDGVCLTTDEKPVDGIANGSILRELNVETGVVKEFMFDQEHVTWIETTGLTGCGCSCSGGSSSGGGLTPVGPLPGNPGTV